MQKGVRCSAAKKKAFAELLSDKYSYILWSTVFRGGGRKRNGGSACESACYSSITKPWKPSQHRACLLCFSWRAWFISQQFLHTHQQADKRQPIIFPRWHTGELERSYPTSLQAPPAPSALDVKQPWQTRVCDRITPTWDLGFKSDGCVRVPSHMTQSDGIECMALHARFQA